MVCRQFALACGARSADLAAGRRTALSNGVLVGVSHAATLAAALLLYLWLRLRVSPRGALYAVAALTMAVSASALSLGSLSRALNRAANSRPFVVVVLSVMF